MKINTHWLLHVEAWRESGLSQADYCRQQGLNRKTFSLWTRCDQGNPSMDRGTSLELNSVQASSLDEAMRNRGFINFETSISLRYIEATSFNDGRTSFSVSQSLLLGQIRRFTDHILFICFWLCPAGCRTHSFFTLVRFFGRIIRL